MREEFTFGGMTGVTAFDGKSGWKIEPWAGKKDAETLGEDEMKGIIEDAEFDDPLFNYKERGNTVELVGTDQVEGTDVYKLGSRSRATATCARTTSTRNRASRSSTK